MPRPKLWWLLVLLPVPPIAQATSRHTQVQRTVVSVTVALVLIALYAGALLFMYVTHEHLFRTPETGERAQWSVRRAVGILAGATVVVAVMSDLLVSALDPTVRAIG